MGYCFQYCPKTKLPKIDVNGYCMWINVSNESILYRSFFFARKTGQSMKFFAIIVRKIDHFFEILTSKYVHEQVEYRVTHAEIVSQG